MIVTEGMLYRHAPDRAKVMLASIEELRGIEDLNEEMYQLVTAGATDRAIQLLPLVRSPVVRGGYAIRLGQRDILAEALEQLPEPPEWWPTLAAEHGSLEDLELIHRAGARLDVAGSTGTTPLMIAAEQGRADFVRYLLEHHRGNLNASAGKYDFDQRTALELAVENGNLEAARALLEAGARYKSKDSKGDNRVMSLAVAQFGNLDIVILLVEHGVPIAPGHALDVARSNDLEQVRYVLGHGGDARYLSRKEREGPLLFPTSPCADPEVVRLYLDGGADPTLKSKRGDTPIGRAETYCPELVSMLKEQGR